MKLNCWEKMQCGCQPGGDRTLEKGICPISTETKANWIHGGINGGRSCWAVVRTLDKKNIPCKIDHKFDSCIQCDFYSEVRAEEGSDYITQNEIMAKLNGG